MIKISNRAVTINIMTLSQVAVFVSYYYNNRVASGRIATRVPAWFLCKCYRRFAIINNNLHQSKI